MKKSLILALIGLVGVLAVGLGIILARLPGGPVATSPKLVTDRDRIDFGQVPYNKTVKAVFELSNDGDQPLKIVGEPQVEVVKGC